MLHPTRGAIWFCPHAGGRLLGRLALRLRHHDFRRETDRRSSRTPPASRAIAATAKGTEVGRPSAGATGPAGGTHVASSPAGAPVPVPPTQVPPTTTGAVMAEQSTVSVITMPHCTVLVGAQNFPLPNGVVHSQQSAKAARAPSSDIKPIAAASNTPAQRLRLFELPSPTDRSARNAPTDPLEPAAMPTSPAGAVSTASVSRGLY